MILGFLKEKNESSGSATSTAKLHGASVPNGSMKTEHPTPIEAFKPCCESLKIGKGCVAMPPDAACI